MTVISCRQLAPRLGDVAWNIDRSVDAVRSAVGEGAAVVVLPELVTSGYAFESRDEAAASALTPRDPVFAAWAAAVAPADGLVVGGFAERDENGRIYNRAAVVDASGVRAVYRKIHLWDREKL